MREKNVTINRKHNVNKILKRKQQTKIFCLSKIQFNLKFGGGKKFLDTNCFLVCFLIDEKSNSGRKKIHYDKPIHVEIVIMMIIIIIINIDDDKDNDTNLFLFLIIKNSFQMIISFGNCLPSGICFFCSLF